MHQSDCNLMMLKCFVQVDTLISVVEKTRMQRRRTIFRMGTAYLLLSMGKAGAAEYDESMTLLSAPLELAGNWGHMSPDAVARVAERIRHVCLDGIRLVSERQPTRLRVDEHTSGLPSIWLHSDNDTTAWIIVYIGERSWSQFAYQFGHELGHVMANSWQQHAKPMSPCQWLEEALVEAFSLRSLGLLAKSWKREPLFVNDGKFSDVIAAYREKIIDEYTKLAGEQGGLQNFASWFVTYQRELEDNAGLGSFAQAASLIFLLEYERHPDCIEALGALNRWPGRSSVPLGDYLKLWEASCMELQASLVLPTRLRELLQIG